MPEYRLTRVRVANDAFLKEMIEEDIAVLQADLKEKRSCGEKYLTSFIDEAIAYCESSLI
jgi:hypothetical protein